MKLETQINRMEKAYSKYNCELYALEGLVKVLCDFRAGVTWCAGDGHLIINDETSDVATMDCLDGITEEDKLTEDVHKDFCI